MIERKQGENEALEILKNIGIEMDEDYTDDNSKPKMPDLRYKNGRFIEVTHTKHNIEISKRIKKFWCESRTDTDFVKKCQQIECIQKSYYRYKHNMYEKDADNNLTETANQERCKDLKILVKHFGTIPTDLNDERLDSEFKADCPIIVHSTDAILREIIDDKGTKYPYGDTDLFLFVTEDEYMNMLNLMPQWKWNGEASIFLYDIDKSPFQSIYICEWDFENLIYNTVDPKMTRFYRNDGTLQWKYYRHSKS